MSVKTKTCRSCFTEINARASVCPACRSKQPDRSKLIAVLALGFVGFTVYGLSGNKQSTATTSTTPEQIAAKAEAKRQEDEAKAKAKAEETARCRADQKCWTDKAMWSGKYDCQKAIERLAKYDFKWTDGWLDFKFSHYHWRDWNKQIITLSGDKIQFQNGFGAWTRHPYYCDVDMSKVDPNKPLEGARVLTARVEPGRLAD